MQNEPDPVDAALESLRGRQWPGDQPNSQLKEKLMSEFHKNNTTSLLRRHSITVGILAVLVFGSVGFAAAGGVEYVQSWFITVQVNGQEVDIDEANVKIEVIDDEVISITLDSAEIDGLDDVDPDSDSQSVTITVEAMNMDHHVNADITVVPEEEPQEDEKEPGEE